MSLPEGREFKRFAPFGAFAIRIGECNDNVLLLVCARRSCCVACRPSAQRRRWTMETDGEAAVPGRNRFPGRVAGLLLLPQRVDRRAICVLSRRTMDGPITSVAGPIRRSHPGRTIDNP